MKYFSKYKANSTWLLVLVLAIVACTDQIIEPVADFKIINEITDEVIDHMNIKAGETIVFQNTGLAHFLTIWTGDLGSVYSKETSTLSYSERERTYVLPSGENTKLPSTIIQKPENTGAVVDRKNGKYSYTYSNAGLSGDTTYTVVWVATNVDVHGNSVSTLKELAIRVVNE